MKLPDKDSPAWPIARQVLVGGMTLLAVTFWYSAGFVARADLPVVLSILGPLLGFDVLKHAITRDK